jgi:hypothetical protein
LIIVVLATLYKWWVFSPSSSKDAASHMHEMEQAGFHGSCGSTDGVHVTMEKCSHHLWQHHLHTQQGHTYILSTLQSRHCACFFGHVLSSEKWCLCKGE